MLGGMRYAQKFFRINFKFYKFLFGVASLKISQKSVQKSFTAHAWRDALRAEILQN